ncbi:DUF1294 domain-containing protein [Pseudomonas sp. v388]|uniref:DUF1294 domain-containing protein n=1 Tax=Pseudomonas sp. v388 TaxID=2479849 RepID=UPI000F7966E2|nr:DUF1294 domain-containing protein [Pseudomonas sp. v388]RRV10790.1 DUF1294 domain-containing protein [Pseudomonas sp. v388]
MRTASAARREPTRSATVQFARLKALAWVLLCAVPGYGAGVLWVRHGVPVAVALYVAVSLLAFVLYRQDKRRAGSGAWRIPEKWLHGAELLGGWPGALLAQQMYRHKTRKVSFQLMFWLIVLVHQAGWVCWITGVLTLSQASVFLHNL